MATYYLDDVWEPALVLDFLKDPEISVLEEDDPISESDSETSKELSDSKPRTARDKSITMKEECPTRD
jgi:hypothetical protein